jgi:hypothetical protein
MPRRCYPLLAVLLLTAPAQPRSAPAGPPGADHVETGRDARAASAPRFTRRGRPDGTDAHAPRHARVETGRDANMEDRSRSGHVETGQDARVENRSGSAPRRNLKVYISADMEGVAGAVTGEQLGPAGFEYARFREFMTAEVLAAIEGARAAGATEFVVSDSHGNGQNLLIERFPADVTIIRSWPRPLGMMEGIDGSFDAAIFIG